MTQPLSEIYSRANQQVQNLLKPGWDGNKFEAERYWDNFCDWLEDHPVMHDAAFRAWGLTDPHDEGVALRGFDADTYYAKLPAAITDEYAEDLASYLEGGGAHLAPTGAHLTAQRQTLLPRTSWLVHFTYQAEAVAQQGFRKGFSNHRRMGMTKGLPESAPEKAGVGYNFAFLATGPDAQDSADTGKYGDGAVMFQSSGVQAYHKGDEESQIMFKGDQVDPSHLVHLKMWNDHSWSVMSKLTRRALFSGDFAACTAWVTHHYAQYRNQFAVSPGIYNKQTMQLKEAKPFLRPTNKQLQEAVARYCSEHQDQIRSGELSLDMLQEGILSGIRSIFGTGGSVRQGAQAVRQAATKTANRVRSDYQVGSAAGELTKLAQQRNAAEAKYDQRTEKYKRQLDLLQAESQHLTQVHSELMTQFHAASRTQYERAAAALNIPVDAGNQFFDAVDQVLESRKMVPALPGALQEDLTALFEGIPGAQRQVTPARTLKPTAPRRP